MTMAEVCRDQQVVHFKEEALQFKEKILGILIEEELTRTPTLKEGMARALVFAEASAVCAAAVIKQTNSLDFGEEMKRMFDIQLGRSLCFGDDEQTQ